MQSLMQYMLSDESHEKRDDARYEDDNNIEIAHHSNNNATTSDQQIPSFKIPELSSSAERLPRSANVGLYLDQLRHTTLLQEKKNALDGLTDLVKTEALGLSQDEMDCILLSLGTDPRDTECLNVCLDLLQSLATDSSPYASMMIEKVSNVEILVSLVENNSTWVRGPALNVLTAIQESQGHLLAPQLLQCKEGMRRLLDVLEDTRDHIRDGMLRLLAELTRGNKELQQFMAFEDAIPTLFSIMRSHTEDFRNASPSDVIIRDCLVIVKNVLEENAMTQRMFLDRAGQISSLIQLTGSKNTEGSLLALEILSLFVQPLFPNRMLEELNEVDQRDEASRVAELPALKSSIGNSCLQSVCELVIERTDTQQLVAALHLLGHLVSSHEANQLALVSAVSSESKSIVAELFKLEVSSNDNSWTDNHSRAVSRVLDIVFTESETAKMIVLQHVTNPPPPMMDDNWNEVSITQPGIVLLEILTTATEEVINSDNTDEEMRAWRSARRLCTLLGEACSVLGTSQEDSALVCKELALRIPHRFTNDFESTSPPLSPKSSSTSTSTFLSRVIRYLSRCVTASNNNFIVTMGMFRLVSSWLKNCPSATGVFLSSVTNIDFLFDILTDKISIRDSSLVHYKGQAALVLALCVLNAKDNGALSSKKLIEMIRHVVGLEVFVDALSITSNSSNLNDETTTVCDLTLFPNEETKNLYSKPYVCFYNDVANETQNALFQIYASSSPTAGDKGKGEIAKIQEKQIKELQFKIERMEQLKPDDDADETAAVRLELKEKSRQVLELESSLESAKCTQSIAEAALNQMQSEFDMLKEKYENIGNDNSNQGMNEVSGRSDELQAELLAKTQELEMASQEVQRCREKILAQDQELLNLRQQSQVSLQEYELKSNSFTGELQSNLNELESAKQSMLDLSSKLVEAEQQLEEKHQEVLAANARSTSLQDEINRMSALNNIPNRESPGNTDQATASSMQQLRDLEDQHRDLLLLLANEEIHSLSFREVLESVSTNVREDLERAFKLACDRGAIET